MSALADIVVPDDARGMRTLLGMLRPDPWLAAALTLLVAQRRLVVATGFPVGGRPETDGPPGAIALARALAALGCGRGVAVASWREVLDLMAPELPASVERLEVPLPPARVAPLEGAVVAIECCGTTGEGARLSMRGQDLRDVTPCFEDAFGDEVLAAVGDGGNEVGMGSAPAAWFERFGVAAPRSRACVLAPAAVSNWGALAIVAALGVLTRTDLLPRPEEHAALVERLVARGAVDGFSGEPVARVDGRDVAEEAAVVAALREWAEASGRAGA